MPVVTRLAAAEAQQRDCNLFVTSIRSCAGGLVLIIGSGGLLGSTLAAIFAASSGPALAMLAFLEGGTLGGLFGVLLVLGLPEIRPKE